MVQWVTRNPGSSPRVRWSASAPGSGPARAGGASDAVDGSGGYEHSAAGLSSGYSRDDMCGAPANSTGWFEPGVLHRAVMTGLAPATLYHYQYGDVVSEGGAAWRCVGVGVWVVAWVGSGGWRRIEGAAAGERGLGSAAAVLSHCGIPCTRSPMRQRQPFGRRLGSKIKVVLPLAP